VAPGEPAIEGETLFPSTALWVPFAVAGETAGMADALLFLRLFFRLTVLGLVGVIVGFAIGDCWATKGLGAGVSAALIAED